MKVTVAVCLLAVAGAALARPQYQHGPPNAYRPAPSYNEVPRYAFDYGVQDNFGNNYGHQESRDGYDTKGSYYVQLPDGRLQRVNYYVNGDSGFVAEVTYEGQARYPAYSPAPATDPPQDTALHQPTHPPRITDKKASNHLFKHFKHRPVAANTAQGASTAIYILECKYFCTNLC
ncbi:cuticle protein 19-like [Portunus trituberculatus]|uniref:cuticle protein 19-like n=1 Tax=Portunus trituberculatus TaxID=210409 RepID=UPI001E1CF6AE|nr:cuticle protein 19-like [Portunus trituberculatus]